MFRTHICTLLSCLCAGGLVLPGAYAVAETPMTASDPWDEQFAPPVVTSERDAERLRNLEGATLQWISWDERGEVATFTGENGALWLTTEVRGEGGAGLKLEGVVTEIGTDYFLFHGEITIMNTPDEGRFCDVNKVWRFEVTQNRSYYRLREFEWCDYLTDYIDIYFAPRLR